MNVFQSKKFRHGSVSLALTVVVVAAVILVNAIFTALANKFLWYIDMTTEQVFTLTDNAKDILDGMDTDKEVLITMCADKNTLESNAAQRYIILIIFRNMRSRCLPLRNVRNLRTNTSI